VGLTFDPGEIFSLRFTTPGAPLIRPAAEALSNNNHWLGVADSAANRVRLPLF